MAAAPFDRVPDGYDPTQVAEFAARALEWKRQLAETIQKLDRYETVIGQVDAVEAEVAEAIQAASSRAASIIAQAERRAAELDGRAAGMANRAGQVEHLTEQAHVEASEIVAAARRQASEIVGQAERQAGEVVAQAERRAEEVIAASDSETGRIAAEYQEKATSLDLARAQVEEEREILAIERARLEAERETLAAERTRSAPAPEPPATPWLTPADDESGLPDPVDAIFEDVDEITSLSDDERAAAARASLFKRRGTLLPQE